MSEKVIKTSDVKAEKAEQSKKNAANGGKPVEVSILDTVNVKFKKDFGKMKKGQTYRISQLAYEVYDKNGVVEKIN